MDHATLQTRGQIVPESGSSLVSLGKHRHARGSDRVLRQARRHHLHRNESKITLANERARQQRARNEDRPAVAVPLPHSSRRSSECGVLWRSIMETLMRQ